jgi:hypothetical protein
MTATSPSRTRYRLLVESENIHRLKAALKLLSRGYGVRCISAVEERKPEPVEDKS